MALVLEDGSGVADADTWILEAETTDYWTARNLTEWLSAETIDREAAIRMAADYMMIVYRWPGQPATLQQRLPWPRVGVPSGASVFPSNAIPSQVISAQMVLAVEALRVNLLAKPAPAERQLIEETKSAKGFSKTQKWSTPSVDELSGLMRFPVADQILTGLTKRGLGSGFGTARLVKGL